MSEQKTIISESAPPIPTVVPEGEKEQLNLAPVQQTPGMTTMWNDRNMMNLTYKFAAMVAKSGLVPDTYRNSPENCIVAIDLGNRLGISPLAVMQNLYIVKGKPAWSGSFCAAAVNGSGKFTPLEYTFVGEAGTPSYGCYASAMRLSTGSRCVSDTITMKMAADEGWLGKPGSKWKTMPTQMLMYRAAAFFARAHCSEYLLGIHTIEEIQDVRGYDAETAPQTVVTLDAQ